MLVADPHLASAFCPPSAEESKIIFLDASEPSEPELLKTETLLLLLLGAKELAVPVVRIDVENTDWRLSAFGNVESTDPGPDGGAEGALRSSGDSSPRSMRLATSALSRLLSLDTGLPSS